MIPSVYSAVPQDLYARLVGREPFYQVKHLPDSAKTLKDSILYKQSNDASLANLDDSLKRVGSAFIATLATLGATRKIMGVGEFLGFGSWFIAMGLTPQIVNGLIWLKTGVNLNQQYMNTQGHRRPIFHDPKYLPLHLISDEEMNEVANRLGIPINSPDRRRLAEEKMRQISVQGRTWWMLMAGPATPVLSGMLCDLFQKPITQLLNGMRSFYHLHIAMSHAFREGAPMETSVKRLETYAEHMVGDIPHSRLSQWWEGFGTHLVKLLGLQKELKIHEVVSPSSVEGLMGKLTDTFIQLQDKAPDRLDKSIEFLKTQKAELKNLKDDTLRQLRKYQHFLETETYERLEATVDSRLKTAQATLDHYSCLLEGLVSLPKQKRGAELHTEIKALFKNPRLAELQKMIEFGQIERAKLFAGSDTAYHEIRELLAKRRFTAAFNRMGAAPSDHLLLSLKNIMLRKLWRTRMLFFLGGGMLLASVLFSRLFVGKDFKQEPENV